METRKVIAIAFALLALVCIVLGVVLSGDTREAFVGLLGNLGAEIVGLVLTVAIIDWLLERKRLNEQVMETSWRMLHDLDHAFWVWQGGRREFHLDELMALLAVADKDDPLPPYTEELFINLGIRASDTLRLQPKLMNHDRRLRAAMKSLSGLAQISEAKKLVDTSYIIDGLKNAVSNLAEITGQTPHAGEFTAAKSFRDPSEGAQQRRYRGSMHESIMRQERFAGQIGEMPAKVPAGG